MINWWSGGWSCRVWRAAELHGRSVTNVFSYGLSREKSALTRSVRMKQKISRRTAPPAPELRHCARAARARRGTPRKPHGAVRQSLQVASSAGRADRSVADASHAAARLPGKAASFSVRQSLQLAKASRERTMGGQDAWVTREQSSRDAMAMPGVREVRSRKTILRRDLRNAPPRAFPARTRGVVFSLATVWRRARPSFI